VPKSLAFVLEAAHGNSSASPRARMLPVTRVLRSALASLSRGVFLGRRRSHPSQRRRFRHNGPEVPRDVVQVLVGDLLAVMDHLLRAERDLRIIRRLVLGRDASKGHRNDAGRLLFLILIAIKFLWALDPYIGRYEFWPLLGAFVILSAIFFAVAHSPMCGERMNTCRTEHPDVRWGAGSGISERPEMCHATSALPG
jgi:hypothetical protein